MSGFNHPTGWNEGTDPGPEKYVGDWQGLALVNEHRENEGLDPLPTDYYLNELLFAYGFTSCFDVPYHRVRLKEAMPETAGAQEVA